MAIKPMSWLAVLLASAVVLWPAYAAEPTVPTPPAPRIVVAKLDPATPHVLIYPPIAIWNEQEGTVKVILLIGSDGWVRDARVMTSSGYSQLDAAALVTVGYWHYLPATRDGVPIPLAHETELRFVMDGDRNWKLGPEPPPPDSVVQSDIQDESDDFLLYPQMARRSAQRGDVTLNILVRAGGYVSNAAVVKSSGLSQLDSAALISVGYWNFLPAIKDGVSVDAWKTVRVHLVPKDTGPESPADEYTPNLPAFSDSGYNGVSRQSSPAQAGPK